MKAAEIREKFLRYFEDRGHHRFPSAALVPQDPTLLFNSAGMVPFKNRFLGLEKGIDRAASCQLCMRTTDIDRVGFTSRHLTFFEMLGNFSFGDYFKKEAIDYAWEFLTKELGLDREKLWVTVYKDDGEAAGFWKKYRPEERIIFLGEDSNFWSMGSAGPCGPCSEIYWDFGADKGCGPDCNPGHDNCERFLEIWNLVFMQFNRQTDGALKPLDRPCIDTGMGLERIACILQDKKSVSVFETDLFIDFQKIWDATGLVHNIGGDPKKEPHPAFAYRVIADHARASAFLISQGVLPSNESRGYILRRLIRRAVRYGRERYAKVTSAPFLYGLVEASANLPAFKENKDLSQRLSTIVNVVKTEEEKFLETLARGKEFMDELMRECAKDLLIPGDKLFYLYETYGYPLELAKEIAREQGFKVDEGGFRQAEEKAKDIARKGWKGSGAEFEAKYIKLREDLKIPKINFTGYESLSGEAAVLAIANHSLAPLKKATEGEDVFIILSKTPFYPEGGGQVGDRGVLSGLQGEAQVTDTQSPLPGLIFHQAKVTRGRLSVGETLNAVVETTFRNQTAKHHSAAHLLHWALRKLVGSHVTQAGSYVGPDKLRLDFTHGSSLKGSALGEIEALVNETIRANVKRERKELTLEEARKQGAMTLFEERYGDKVFVVRFGESFEACGGTHVLTTSEIENFKVLKESSVAAGVRRIEAASSRALAQWQESKKQATPIPIKKEEKPKILGTSETLEGKTAKGVPYKIQIFAEGRIDLLRPLNDGERRIFHGIIFHGVLVEGKMGFILGLNPDLAVRGMNAIILAKALTEKFGGKGGGRPDFAQGGFSSAPSPHVVEQALLELLS
ncbi:MAG: alanine--tRNA ligase [Elusimicrobia bacterium]|nr:alanine--tRNA ligase [Elusimicrobiota bacterium]